jgi:predicted PurR-regulated permease PerM
LLALALFCWQVFAPFATLTLWGVILAVTLAPAHALLRSRLGGRDGAAATLVVLLGLGLLVAPTAFIAGSLGDSLQHLVGTLRDDGLKIPAPPPGVGEWPVIGHRVEALWSRAHTDMQGLVAGLRPTLMQYAKQGLGFAAGIGLGIAQFIGAMVLAGILLAWRDAGIRGSHAVLIRIAGVARGTALVKLATQTLRAVAQGVIGVAMIQAILVGLCLIAAGIPWAGILAGLVLVIGIAQLPALLVTLPAIAYLWWSDLHSPVMAGTYTVLLLVGGMADNVLKPILLGRGTDVPMPVVLIGALGGAASGGILGIFVGATVLAFGYRLLMSWVYD